MLFQTPFNKITVFISGGPDARFFALNQANQILVKNTADMALERDVKYTVSKCFIKLIPHTMLLVIIKMIEEME